MQSNAVPLKYLFTATFADGSEIVQTPEDRSELEPEKRSQFYDVLERAKQVAMTRFELREAEGARRFAVDLRDGAFEAGGERFFIHDDHTELVNKKTVSIPLSNFRIVFFRTHKHSFNVGVHTQEEISHEIVYRFGWQATVNGVNYQRVMQID